MNLVHGSQSRCHLQEFPLSAFCVDAVCAEAQGPPPPSSGSESAYSYVSPHFGAKSHLESGACTSLGRDWGRLTGAAPLVPGRGRDSCCEPRQGPDFTANGNQVYSELACTRKPGAPVSPRSGGRACAYSGACGPDPWILMPS